MSTSITYQVQFSKPGRRMATGMPRMPSVATEMFPASNVPSKPENGPERNVGRVARMLALAYHVERQVESGAIRDYAAAARALGVTRARVTQVMNLLVLSPKTQEDMLVGKTGLTERRLRTVSAEVLWERQAEALQRTLPHRP